MTPRIQVRVPSVSITGSIARQLPRRGAQRCYEQVDADARRVVQSLFERELVFDDEDAIDDTFPLLGRLDDLHVLGAAVALTASSP